jgi:hypothetical protein
MVCVICELRPHVSTHIFAAPMHGMQYRGVWLQALAKNDKVLE